MDGYVGETLAGRYEIVSLLGEGGMGAVYRAHQRPLGREVALKLIKGGLSGDACAIARFEREARALAGLQHPNVVAVHDFGHADDGALFLVMELLTGDSLRATLQREHRLDWRRALPLITDLCRALAEAHRAGIVHRDLKPDNVMLLEDAGGHEYAKVLDFGVAKLLGEARSLTSGGLVGTPGYIAPEQMNGVSDDPRSDLYALGVVWYQLLSGFSPFQSRTPIGLALKHMVERPPDLQSRAPCAEIPAEVSALVMRLLEKDPARRARSARALLEEIDGLRGLPAPPRAARPPRPRWSQPPLHSFGGETTGTLVLPEVRIA